MQNEQNKLNTKIKTAVFYGRYSSDKQTEQSIDGQFRACKDYAEKNNILIVDEYIDRAMTGKNDNRASFQKMLKDSYKKAWDYVLVYRIDRFGRNKYEIAINKHTLKENGVKVLSAMENIPDTPEGVILESLLEGMAEYYSIELAQKVRRGQNESRLKGQFTGGALLFGYKVENKKISIDNDKANIVKYVFQEYANGKIAREIIEDLTNKGIYTSKGKPFVNNTIYGMLSNEKYLGILRCNDEIFTNIYPQIVTKEIFDKVNERLQKNKLGRPSAKAIYLLRQKMFCGYCGKIMFAESGTSKSGKISRYYKCSTKKRGNVCCKEQEKKEELEDLIVNTTIQSLSDNNIDLIANKLLEVEKKYNDENSILNILLKDKKEVDSCIDNLVSAIEQGIVTSTTKSRLLTLEEKRDLLASKIAIEESQKEVLITKKDITSYIKNALKQKPQTMLNLLIKNITIFNNKIEITYNCCDSKRPDEKNHQVFSFYKTIATLPKLSMKSNKISKKQIKIELFA